MPVDNAWIQKLTEVLGPLRCDVEIPSAWNDFFERQGQIPTGPDDKRRYARNYFRGMAALGFRSSLPAVPRSKKWCAVYMKDLSRSGTAFLHSEQLFPMEQMQLLWPNGQTRAIEVTRCRRVQENCFEIGADFIGEFRPDEGSTGAS